MDNFTTNFNDFINQRLADNTEKLKKNKSYNKNELKFYKLEDSILNEASKKEKKQLNILFSALYDMQTEENFLAYKLGFFDGFNFNNSMKNN